VTIEERLIASAWIHERDIAEKSMANTVFDFESGFHKKDNMNRNLRKLEGKDILLVQFLILKDLID